jgi:hypothetical protein
LQFLGRAEQARTPLGKNRRDLVVVFLGDELITASLRFKQEGIQRPLVAIVRMKMELPAG